ncbi:MAG: hypothetical protein WC384_20900 [Prolixibacteraceae bacterium]|jgi:hypothetical protein
MKTGPFFKLKNSIPAGRIRKKKFKTSNAPVVFAVMEEIKATLDERIKEVEIRSSSHN